MRYAPHRHPDRNDPSRSDSPVFAIPEADISGSTDCSAIGRRDDVADAEAYDVRRLTAELEIQKGGDVRPPKHAGSKETAKPLTIRFFGAIAALALIGLLAGIARATSGDLDPMFGTDGLVTTAVPYRDAVIEDVALQADGKIVTAGWLRDPAGGWPEPTSFLVARYDAAGTLDESFGTGGISTATVGPSSGGTSVAIQSDGKIVVGGGTTEGWTFALARFSPDGTLDPGFGSGGKVITNVGINSSINDLAIQPDGKIVVGGGNGDWGDARNFIVARYLSNGTLDQTFGTGGVAFTNFYGRGGMARALAVQPDGKIVEVGYTGLPSYPWGALGAVRFNSDGTLDATFGTGGKATTSFGAGGAGWDVALRPDGKIVAVGGASTNAANGGFGVAQFNSDGTLDTSFGGVGWVFTDFGSSSDDARSVALRPDGKIVAAGDWVTPSYNGDFALAQYNADGSLDTSFGVRGKVTTDFGSSEAANALAVQPDGAVVAAGVVSGDYARMGLARYLGVDSTPPDLTVSVTPSVLWPPNHLYVTVRATVYATDDSGVDPSIELVSLTSNEPDNGADDGNTANDIVASPTDPYTVQLRAERSGTGRGRVYTLTYRATDGSGNSTTKSATVIVPISP
jgi:uncharacterized delta-60 repeat protein